MGLNDIRVKLDRAKEHLKAFESEVDRFVEAKPPPLHVVTYQGSNEVRGIEWTRRPPALWGAIVGDCVHNLRSLLDHVAWDLSGGAWNAPNGCEFPIFSDFLQFYQRDKKGEPARGSGLWKIRGVIEDGAAASIRRLQPFQGSNPTRHPLWIIHELDRLDKHRSLHVVTGWAYDHTFLVRKQIREVSDLPPGLRRARGTQSSLSRAQVGTGVKTKVKMRFDLTIRVSLEHPTVGSDEDLDVLLSRLIDFVEFEVLGAVAMDLEYP